MNPIVMVCEWLSFVTPFTFVFCLVYAIRDAVRGEGHAVRFALGAAVSLWITVWAVLGKG